MDFKYFVGSMETEHSIALIYWSGICGFWSGNGHNLVKKKKKRTWVGT